MVFGFQLCSNASRAAEKSQMDPRGLRACRSPASTRACKSQRLRGSFVSSKLCWSVPDWSDGNASGLVAAELKLRNINLLNTQYSEYFVVRHRLHPAVRILGLHGALREHESTCVERTHLDVDSW